MREIKFRAWDKEAEQVVEYTSYADFPNSKRFEFMQYTGLKDKNGKEIYEGDVVVHHDIVDVKFEVKADEANACYILEERRLFCQFDRFTIARLEVIGNIYENKDLLNNN